MGGGGRAVQPEGAGGDRPGPGGGGGDRAGSVAASSGALAVVRLADMHESYSWRWGKGGLCIKLGEGVQGKVILVQRHSDGLLGARKSYKRGGRPEEVERELAALRQLAARPSPNVTSPWAVVMDGARVDSLIFEHAEETLSQRFQRHHNVMPPDLVVSLVADLVAGLAHLHQLGWAHRDVKMDNLLLQKLRRNQDL